MVDVAARAEAVRPAFFGHAVDARQPGRAVRHRGPESSAAIFVLSLFRPRLSGRLGVLCKADWTKVQ